ncbi:MAG: hypothetical protein F6K09_37945 [Merismopedia sp. SIO2A8]|nr:hypothetical protein [Symploca sp. SIO2B6]NET54192.1 hypothetical protein [Merismopedia sp. SIO2A8]
MSWWETGYKHDSDIVAIDLDTGDFAVDASEIAACDRPLLELRERSPFPGRYNKVTS